MYEALLRADRVAVPRHKMEVSGKLQVPVGMHPMHRRLGGPVSTRVEKQVFPLLGIEPGPYST
jgi:hypothetical protein